MEQGLYSNSEMPTFSGIDVGSQYLGMGSILLAVLGPVKTVGGLNALGSRGLLEVPNLLQGVLGRIRQQVSPLDNPLTLQKDILNLSLSLTVYVYKYCTLIPTHF